MPGRRMRLLTLDGIVDAAIALVDDDGRLTMPDLAKRLGVSVSSIYHHVSGRAALVELIRSRLGGPLGDAVDDTGDWEPAVTGWLRAYRASFARHPRLIPLLTGQTVTAKTAMTTYNRVARVLARAGFPRDRLVLWISVLDSYALGSALDLAAPAVVWADGAGRDGELGAALAEAPAGRARSDDAFELGLRSLLTGMHAELSSVQAGTEAGTEAGAAGARP